MIQKRLESFIYQKEYKYMLGKWVECTESVIRQHVSVSSVTRWFYDNSGNRAKRDYGTTEATIGLGKCLFIYLLQKNT